MNIVVCVKYVPDATADRKFEVDNTVDRVGVDGLLSELDEYAVEQALQLKEKAGDDTEVTALCIGPEKAVDAVRKALQMGADKGVQSSTRRSPAPTTSPPRWCWPRPIEKIGAEKPVDLVMCGMAVDRRLRQRGAGDARRAPGPAAGHLRLGQVETQGDQVRIKRDSDTATEVIGATMPLVLSVTDQTGEARYPSFKGIMAAKKKPMETWSLADLGVDAGEVGLSVAWTEVEDTTARPPRTAGEIVKDEDGSGAPALAGFLASKKFI